ncbi:MAG: protein kinase [Vicinamibacterales bacterium]
MKTDDRWRRIEAICQSALDRPPSERATFLESACDGDLEILREIEGLLSNESALSQFLDASAPRTLPSNTASLSGTLLDEFEVGELIGVGGMGEVYRARDPRLNRDVAIKVLRRGIVGQLYGFSRLEREAQLLASFNHPGIAAIHGVADLHSNIALVMELVDGVTLLEHVRAAPIPVDEVVAIAAQIADAVDAAHQQGVVHLDLKPANIKLSSNGIIKILDFGLARTSAETAEESQRGRSASELPSGPDSRQIIGTPSYMSPEQVLGGGIDKRSDIWAFGCILYEMLTGRRAFHGETVPEIMSLVLKSDPDWPRLERAAPGALTRLVRRCLEKDRRVRLRDIGDARFDLLDAVQSKADDVKRGPAFTLSIVAPTGVELPTLASQTAPPQISPDGSAVMCGAVVRSLDSLDVRELPVTLSGQAFWAPDSSWVACPSRGELLKVHLASGHIEVITPFLGPTRGGTWSESGRILIAGNGRLCAVSASGGAPEPVEIPEFAAGDVYRPEFLEETDHFLFWSRNRQGVGHVFLGTLRDGRVCDCKWLMQNETAVHYSPANGCILFVRGNGLCAQRLNIRQRAMCGAPHLVVSGVSSAPHLALASFTVSRAGLIAWRPGAAVAPRLMTFDRSGKELGSSGPANAPIAARLSPDEQRLIVECEQPGTKLLEVGKPSCLELGEGRWSVWCHDGTRLVGVDRLSSRLAYRTLTATAEVRTFDTTLPSDTRLLEDCAPGLSTAVVTTLDGTAWSVPLSNSDRRDSGSPQTPPNVACPRLSPDGRWLVYRGEGRSGLYIQPYPDGLGQRRQIATQGTYPVWRRDGREIVFYQDQRIWSVEVTAIGGQLRLSPAVPLFEIRQSPGLVSQFNPLGISMDGSRIFFPSTSEPVRQSVVHLTSGWSST